MRRALPTLTALAGLLAATPAAAAPARPSIAMLGVSGGAGFDPRILTTIEELLLTDLQNLHRFEVVGQSDIARLIGFERQKQMMGCSDSACMAEMAGALGVDYVMSADIGKLGEVTVVTSKLIDARKGSVVARASRTVSTDSALPAAVESLVRELAEAIPDKGSPTSAAVPPPAAPPPPTPPPPPAPEPAVATAPAAPPAPEPAAPSHPASPEPPPAPAEVVAHAPEPVAPPAEPPQGSRRFSPMRAPPPSPSNWGIGVRAGFGGLTGIMGLGLEFRVGWVTFGVGSGSHRFTAGVSLERPGEGSHVYADVHAAWVATGFIGKQLIPGFGVGASAGWDWRPARWLSVKMGLGLGWSSANVGASRPIFLDSNVGLVF